MFQFAKLFHCLCSSFTYFLVIISSSCPSSPSQNAFYSLFPHGWRHIICLYFPAWDVSVFVSLWPLFFLHIFRHGMFSYLLPHASCLVRILSGMECFVICYLMANEVIIVFSSMRYFVIPSFGRWFWLQVYFSVRCLTIGASLPMLGCTYFPALHTCFFFVCRGMSSVVV